MSERADRREERTRDAIQKTARTWREANAQGGVQISQSDAEARVRAARERGDRQRNDSP